MYRKCRQLALATVFVSAMTAGGTAVLSGPALATDGYAIAGIAPQASEPGGSVQTTTYSYSESPLMMTAEQARAEEQSIVDQARAERDRIRAQGRADRDRIRAEARAERDRIRASEWQSSGSAGSDPPASYHDGSRTRSEYRSERYRARSVSYGTVRTAPVRYRMRERLSELRVRESARTARVSKRVDERRSRLLERVSGRRDRLVKRVESRRSERVRETAYRGGGRYEQQQFKSVRYERRSSFRTH
ncbi:hypothetical protein [Microbispora sp. H13382]|uniref:hypothetical protein n=1 Tax=Microbispora sp. H13382 TaxID=2729112 RepID=UPI0016019DC6|nr:hypothetical protein [Microbispora sp. H13382]